THMRYVPLGCTWTGRLVLRGVELDEFDVRAVTKQMHQAHLSPFDAHEAADPFLAAFADGLRLEAQHILPEVHRRLDIGGYKASVIEANIGQRRQGFSSHIVKSC